MRCLCNSQLHKNYGCADILDNNTFGTRDVKLTRLKRWFEKKNIQNNLACVLFSHQRMTMQWLLFVRRQVVPAVQRHENGSRAARSSLGHRTAKCGGAFPRRVRHISRRTGKLRWNWSRDMSRFFWKCAVGFPLVRDPLCLLNRKQVLFWNVLPCDKSENWFSGDAELPQFVFTSDLTWFVAKLFCCATLAMNWVGLAPNASRTYFHRGTTVFLVSQPTKNTLLSAFLNASASTELQQLT